MTTAPLRAHRRRWWSLALCLLTVAAWGRVAAAQIQGEVRSIGLEGIYRPGAWTALLVRLRTSQPQSRRLLLQVSCDDLDHDRPLYTRAITLTGGPDSPEQYFWTYFVPPPGGLVDSGGGRLDELNGQLKVYVADEQGRVLLQLPLTQLPVRVEGKPLSGASVERGAKLIVSVNDGKNEPPWRQLQQGGGLTEDLVFVSLRRQWLPDHVLGYEGVDAVVWSGAVPLSGQLESEAAQLAALREYVRGGGRLVICQSTQWKEFADLTPVQLGETAQMDLYTTTTATVSTSRPTAPALNITTSQPLDDALVAKWAAYRSEGPERGTCPYLVRRGYGCGVIDWVAQDLADPVLLRTFPRGWGEAWLEILDFAPRGPGALAAAPDNAYAPTDSTLDVSASLRQGLNFTSRGAGLIFLAMLFFVTYGLAAGPGLALLLRWRGRSDLNWPLFAAVAVAGALLTILLVKLMLGGPPQLKSITLVRQLQTDDAHCMARAALYIPKDGRFAIELPPGERAALRGWIPVHASAAEAQNAEGFLSQREYEVPIVESDQPARVQLYFRSTMKSLEGKWRSPARGGIEGTAQLSDDKLLSGLLTNGTDQVLSDVYLGCRLSNDSSQLRVVYLPRWNAGQTIELRKIFHSGDALTLGTIIEPTNGRATPGLGSVVTGQLNGIESANLDTTDSWASQWYARFRKRDAMAGAQSLSDATGNYRDSLPMLSFFDLLPTPRSFQASEPAGRRSRSPAQNPRIERFELLRPGGRFMDISAAISAGRLVVLTASQEAWPRPWLTQGRAIAQSGAVLYQFVVPVKRSNHPPQNASR